jgi:hypothetical protein
VEKTVAEAPHVAHLTEADFLVDEDHRVEKTIAETPHVAHLTETDFLVDEDDRVEKTIAEAPHVAPAQVLVLEQQLNRLQCHVLLFHL